MNKPVALTLVFVLVLPAALQAQDAPRADIYVGFPLLYREGQTQNFLRTSFGVSIPLGRLSN